MDIKGWKARAPEYAQKKINKIIIYDNLKADQEPIKSVTLRKAFGKRRKYMCVLAAIISFSKVLQERDERGQEVTGSPAKVERNKKTLKIQNFSVLVKLMVSVPQILEDKVCRSEKKLKKKGDPDQWHQRYYSGCCLATQAYLSDITVDSMRWNRRSKKSRV